jgi:hypothetical protein
MTSQGPVDAVRRELRAAVADLRSSLARVSAGPSPQDRSEFERQALRGVLGPDARELAHRLGAGLTTWDRVLRGTSSDADLLAEHLGRMLSEHGAAVQDTLSPVRRR